MGCPDFHTEMPLPLESIPQNSQNFGEKNLKIQNLKFSHRRKEVVLGVTAIPDLMHRGVKTFVVDLTTDPHDIRI